MKGVYLISIMDVCIMQLVGLTVGIRMVMVSMPLGIHQVLRNDIFDMYPEVYVSRLPCTTVSEVNVVVNKILTYESTGPAAKPWYKTFIGIGGKTFANYSGKPDGEYCCDLAYNYTKNAIPDLQLVRCYSTNRDTGGLTPTPKDITKSITQGAGYVDFEGHGSCLRMEYHLV